VLKKCSRCQQAKARCEFNISRAALDGLHNACRPCSTQVSAEWKATHPGAYKTWYRVNKEHKKQYFKQYRAKNPEHHRENYRQWARANPGRINALVMRRHIAKFQATPKWADQTAIRAIYQEAAQLTRQTGIRHEVDHIVPLRSPIVCGLHIAANLQILTSAANKEKSNNFHLAA